MNQPQPLRNTERVEQMQDCMEWIHMADGIILGKGHPVQGELQQSMRENFDEFERLAHEATAEL